MTRSEVEKLMENNIKIAVEVGTRRVVTGILEETIEDAFTVNYDEQKERVKKPIRTMVEGALIDIVGPGRLDTILDSNVDKFAKSNRFLDTLARRVVRSTFIILPFPAFFKRSVSKMVEEVRFKRTLEHQLTIQGMMAISPPRSSSLSPKFEPGIFTPSEQSV